MAKASKGEDKGPKAIGKPSDRLEDLLKLMEEENLHELEIAEEGFEVKLVRHGRVPVAMPGHVRAHAAGHHAAVPAAASAKAAEDLGNLKPVKAPLAGIFYRSPSPQSPPFIKEGDAVSQDKAVCIIEAMKVLNEINAGVSGTVARILVENGKPIQAGQTLFLIEPAG